MYNGCSDSANEARNRYHSIIIVSERKDRIGDFVKRRGYYLKQVCFILTCEQVYLPFQESVRELRQAGISVEVLWAEEVENGRDETGSGMCSGRNCLSEEYLSVCTQGKSQVLYVTDKEAIANVIRLQGAPVLGYKHADNEKQGFVGIPYILEEPAGTPAEFFERVFRRYTGLPWSILETERCYVRESCEEDVESFYMIYKEPSVTRYTEGLFEHQISERAYIREYIEKVYAYFEFGIWTVILKESGEIIGRAGISIREGYNVPELGYVFGVPWQGKGLAKEVCEGILKYAKEELEITQLQVLIQEGNEASIRLADRLGFKKEETPETERKSYIRMLLKETPTRD